MKTSFVSTLALQNSLRLQIQTSQEALAQAQKEATTGFYADTGLALGAKTSNVVDLTNNVNQMQALIDSNGLVDERLSSAQAALGQMSDDAQTALNALISVTGSDNPVQISNSRNEVKNAFQSFIGSVNLAANGEYLFGGTNTSVKPLNDFFASGSPAKAAFEQAFQDYFGFSVTDPQTATIQATSTVPTDKTMQGFLDTVVTPMFEGSGWTTATPPATQAWSNASDQAMTSRINTNEVVTSSTTANSEGIRKFTMAAVLGVELLGGNFSAGVSKLVVSKASETMGEAITALDGDRSQLGVAQARVKSANTALQNQTDIVNTQIANLTSVDPTEAATRVNMLRTQIEASYSLTARIQQLSLVDFL